MNGINSVRITVNGVNYTINTVEPEEYVQKLADELTHCILAHHGELEYGSPKKPALAEALILSFADNMDAKMEAMEEAFGNAAEGSTDWLGFNRSFDSNIRKTGSW